MNSLRARILILLGAFGLTIALVLAAIMYSSVRDYYTDMQYKRSSEFAERLLDMHPKMWAEYEANPVGFGEKLQRYVLYAPKVGLYLVSNDGQILSTAGDNKLFWSSHRINVKKIQASLAQDPNQPIYADDPDLMDGICLVAARPLGIGGEQKGWLYVVARYADTDTALLSLLKTYSIKTATKLGLLTIGIGVLLTMAIIAMLTRPLAALTRVAEEIKQRGFTSDFTLPELKLPYCSRHDEIGRLSRTFEEMLQRLQTEMQRVTNADNKRREMVASVSHDLRTPLTALTAQIETIKLKGSCTDFKERDQYFDRALQNAHHMKRLTDSLAEVSRLDNPEFKAQPEPMAIGELADDVTQRFSDRAEQLGVTLQVDYPDRLPWAEIDAGLIERALSNLIDNALRVTPTGGEIQVAVSEVGNGVRVEVSDTGPGVASEDQTRVFDMFYQASKHRHTRGSSGLGLPIVRRIAELHGGHAGLRDKMGPGSTFFIQLPIAA